MKQAAAIGGTIIWAVHSTTLPFVVRPEGSGKLKEIDYSHRVLNQRPTARSIVPEPLRYRVRHLQLCHAVNLIKWLCISEFVVNF
jgi:hypothetical protein